MIYCEYKKHTSSHKGRENSAIWIEQNALFKH